MLTGAAALPDVAGVEYRHHRLTLDEHASVGELPVTFVLGTAKARFGPVRAPLVCYARRAHRLRIRRSGCVRGDSTQGIQICAGFQVLNVVADQGYRPALFRGLDIEARNRVQ